MRYVIICWCLVTAIGQAAERSREKLDRGVIALPVGDSKTYVGWRLLESDAPDTTFNVYRRSDKGKAVRLSAEPIRKTTDFVDAAPFAAGQQYFVRAIVAGKEGSDSEPVATTTTIKLRGMDSFQKVAVADLDGDGRYDYVVKGPDFNVDPYKNYWKKSPDTYKLEAYRHDGKFLWRADLGWSIEMGIWYSPYVVYDFDGDGRAEVAVKTGEGDPRAADGRVTKGPEYLSILDGRTGKQITRVDWPLREGYPDYNYYCRNQLGVAYLDGKTPALIVERGTYNTIKLVAYEFQRGKLRQLWKWTDTDGGPQYRGQGAHCLRAADVDDDERDEVIIGSACIDDNGVALWSTGLGHPDHMTVGQLDPARPGLQIHYGIEPGHKQNSICMVDARDGKILWGLNEPTKHIHSSGLCADIDAAYPGCECYGGERDFKDKRWLFSAAGKLIATKDLGGLAPRAAYWDADLQRELKDDIPDISGSIVAVLDLLGDWREEIITSTKGELRIYSTTIPATDRRVTLMRDPIYRLDVATQSQGYYQIPGLSVLPSAQ